MPGPHRAKRAVDRALARLTRHLAPQVTDDPIDGGLGACVDALAGFAPAPGQGGEACTLFDLVYAAGMPDDRIEAGERLHDHRVRAGRGRALAAHLVGAPGRAPAVRLLNRAAVISAGLAWPALPESRAWRGSGLSAVNADANALVAADGGLRGGLAASASALWALCLARALALASGTALPAGADAALRRGVDTLSWVGGPTGLLPGETIPTPLPPAGALSHALHAQAVAWGLRSGPAGGPPPLGERRALGQRGQATGATQSPAVASNGPPPLDPSVRAPDGSRWQVRAWHDVHAAAARGQVRGQPARLWADETSIEFVVGTDIIARHRGAGCALHSARGDGRDARIHHRGREHERRLDLSVGRLVLRLQGRGAFAIDLPPALVPDNGGWTASLADSGRTLRVTADGAPWTQRQGQLATELSDAPTRLFLELRG